MTPYCVSLHKTVTVFTSIAHSLWWIPWLRQKYNRKGVQDLEANTYTAASLPENAV